MTDIKELIRGILDAELVEQKGELEGLTLRQMNAVNAIAWNVAQRFLAAYIAEQEPEWYHYCINDNWDGFSKELPPDDACDEGTLTKLFTAPPLPKPAPKEAGFHDVAEFYKEPAVCATPLPDCILCANGNDLPEGEYCRGCGRSNESNLKRAVRLARGSSEPPSVKIGFAAPASEEVQWMLNHLRAIRMTQAADLIESLAKQVQDADNEWVALHAEIYALKQSLAARVPVGWLDGRGRFFYADDPMYKNNHEGMREVFAAAHLTAP